MTARLRAWTRLHRVPAPLVVIVAILFLNNTAVGPARALLPVYVERDLGLSPAFTSVLLSLETALGGLVSVAAGRQVDRLGHRLVLALGIVGFSAGMLQFVTASAGMLAALAVVLGVGHGMRSTAGQSYMLSAARHQSVGVSTAAFFLGGTVGTAVGSAAAGPLIDAFGFGAYALAGLALNLAPAAITLRCLREVRPAQRRSDDSAARSTLRVLARREVLLLGALRFFPTVFFGIWSFALPLLVFRATHSVLAAALYVAAGMGLSVLAQFAAGRWSDRRGRAAPMFTALLVLVATAAAAALAWESVAVLTTAGVLGVMGAWTMSVLVLGAVRDRTAPLERGRVVGFVHALWSFGLLLGTVAAGALLDLDPAAPLALGAAANLAALLVAALLFANRRSPAPAAPG